MTLMKSALVAAVLLFATASAQANPLNVEVKGNGTCDVTVGTSLSAAGEVRGSGLGRADYAASIDLGVTAYSLPGGGDCTAADGTVSFTRPGGHVLVADVAGVVCNPVGGSDLVFEGSYAVDATSSTGSRYSGATGSGNLVIGCYGSAGGGAGFAAAAHVNGTLTKP